MRLMKLPIILIGPIGVGKSTIAKILANKLSLRHFPLDYLEAYYATRAGMDLDKEQELVEGNDFALYTSYKHPYEIATVEGVLKESEFCKGIIHFGAGHSFYEDSAHINRAKDALKGFENVVLLLPSEDLDISSKTLKDRLIERENLHKTKKEKLESMILVNEKFLRALSNQELATKVIYTEGKTPVQVADEIIQRAS